MSRSLVLASGAGSSAGPLGFLIVLLLLVTTWLLVRNMSARLRRLPKHFGDEPPEVEGTAGGTAGDTVDDPDGAPEDDPDSLAG